MTRTKEEVEALVEAALVEINQGGEGWRPFAELEAIRPSGIPQGDWNRICKGSGFARAVATVMGDPTGDLEGGDHWLDVAGQIEMELAREGYIVVKHGQAFDIGAAVVAAIEAIPDGWRPLTLGPPDPDDVGLSEYPWGASTVSQRYFDGDTEDDAEQATGAGNTPAEACYALIDALGQKRGAN